MPKLDEITFNDDIDILGKFSLIENVNDWGENKIDGSLIFKNGSARLKILGSFLNPTADKVETSFTFSGKNELSSSSEAIIYGLLSNGNFIKLESFMLTNTTVGFPGLQTSEYTIFRLKVYSHFPKNLNEQMDYYAIDINNLVHWGALPSFFKDTDYSKVGSSVHLGNFNHHGFLFDLKLQPAKFKKPDPNDRHHLEIYNKLNFIIKPCNEFSSAQLTSVSDDLNEIVTLLIHEPSFIRSIQGFKKNNTIRTNLISNMENFNDLSTYIPQRSKLSFFNLQDEFPEILTNFFARDSELDNVITTVFMNISVKNNIESRLINNSNTIDILYKSAKFTNGKKVKDLLVKIRLFIEDLPLPIKNVFFESEESISLFCTQIKNTRDFFTHGISTRPHILKDIELFSATNKLDWLLATFVYYKLGIPEKNIVDYLQQQPLSILEGDIIQ